MKKPLHSIFRKNLRKYLYSFTSLFKNNSSSVSEKINIQDIKTLLLIRPNYRIGNIIFLTPLINELGKIAPHIKIDVIVGMKLAGNILEPMPNISNVIDFPRETLKNPLKTYQIIKKTREINYDLAINITPGSVSSEIVTALVRAKNKASFQNNKTFISLTHTILDEKLYTHAGSLPLEFLKLFNKNLPKTNVKLDIKLTQNELYSAQNDFENLIKNHNIAKSSKVIALFRNARYDKKIEDAWWNKWHQELLHLDKNITIIDVLSPDIASKLNEKCLEYSNKNLRVLGAFFHTCDMYVSADTGPLHLSCASDAKSVALFNKTKIEKFGTIGEKNITIDINNLTTEDVAKLCYNHLLKEV